MEKEIEIIKDFSQGNVCDVSIEKKDIPILSFSPSPKGGPECLWFYFKVKVSGIKKLKLALKHSYNMLEGGQPENFRPVIKFGSNDWERLSKPEIVTLNDGRKIAFWNIEILNKNYTLHCLFFPKGRRDIKDIPAFETNCPVTLKHTIIRSTKKGVLNRGYKYFR